LGVAEGTALLKLVGQLYNHSERVLDYSISYFIPGHFKFHVTRRVDS
jgi:GntR family transcriptional regulator